MSQGVIPMSAGGGGAAVRTKINAALARLQTKASGTSRPSDIAAGEEWIETDNPGGGVWSWWLYDGSTDILLGTINSSTHAVVPTAALAKSLLTAKGSLVKGGTSGTPGEFTVGSAHRLLGVNPAGDDLEYKRPGWMRVADDSNPSGASAVTFSSIPSTCKALEIDFDLTPATNDVNLHFRVSQGGSLITSSNYYSVVLANYNGGGSYANAGAIASATAQHVIASRVRNSTSSNSGKGVRGRLTIAHLQTADFPWWQLDYMLTDVAGNFGMRAIASGFLGLAGAVDGFSLFFSSGNVATGTVSAKGLFA